MGDANTSFVAQDTLRRIFTGDIDVDTDTIAAALVGTSFDGDPENLTLDGVTTLDEIEVTNYVTGHSGAGRKDLSITITTDDTNNQIEIDATNLTWSSLGGTTNDTVAGILYFKQGASDDTTAYMLGYASLTCTNTNGSDFTVQFDAEGIMKVTDATP